MARSETLGTRTTPTTKKLIRLAAEERGESVSRWAAHALRREALRQLHGESVRTRPGPEGDSR